MASGAKHTIVIIITLYIDALAMISNIGTHLAVLAVWLNLHGHVSRKVIDAFLHAIQIILSLIFMLFNSILQAYGHSLVLQPPFIPNTIRSIYTAYNLNPVIIRTIRCPKCFKLYPGSDTSSIPKKCTYRMSPSQAL